MATAIGALNPVIKELVRLVVRFPGDVTLRTFPLFKSAIYRLPVESKAMPLGILNCESVKVLPSRLPAGFRLPCTGPPPSVVTVTSASSRRPEASVSNAAQIKTEARAKGEALRFRDRKNLVVCISQMILFLSLGAGSFHRFCPVVR